MDGGKKSQLWKRLAIIAVTAALLWIVFRRLQLDALRQAFRTMHWSWFVAATLLYGTAFLFAAWRWHLVLRLTGTAVHAGATARLTLIGHFFYNILFGAVGGDTAKSALYARWFGWRLPVVLATIPIDRLLGLSGLIVLGSIGLAFKAGATAFTTARIPGFKPMAIWTGAFVLASLVLLFLLKRLKPGSAWKSFRSTFLGRSKPCCLRRDWRWQGC